MGADFSLDDRLTTLPGYHLLFALVGSTFHTADIGFMRFISIILASYTVLIYYKLKKVIFPSLKLADVYSFLFFPLFFPFFFLLYTDILSLALFLSSLYCGLNRRYNLSALLGFLNLVVRQNTIFWYLFTFSALFITHYPIINVDAFWNYLKKSWSFIVGMFIFVIFVIINKGVSNGDKSMHPEFSIHFGNVFFYLFLIGIAFLPSIIKGLTIKELNYRHFILTGIFFLVYYYTFNVDHPYNTESPDRFLRNDILLFVSGNEIYRMLFFIPILLGVLLFSTFQKNYPKIFTLYIICGILSLIPSWLIDPRYYFIHITILFIYGTNYKKDVALTILIPVQIILCTILMFYIFSETLFI
jgi:alpha-1,2-glucosyltransferase